MKKYRYMVVASITEWVGNDIVEKWKAEEIVVAENEWNAMNMFTDGIYEKYGTYEKDIDIDDIKAKCLGPADVFLSATIDAYVTGILDTVTVGELIEILKDNFDADSKIYLANYYSDRVPVYGGITEECFKYEDGDQ